MFTALWDGDHGSSSHSFAHYIFPSFLARRVSEWRKRRHMSASSGSDRAKAGARTPRVPLARHHVNPPPRRRHPESARSKPTRWSSTSSAKRASRRLWPTATAPSSSPGNRNVQGSASTLTARPPDPDHTQQGGVYPGDIVAPALREFRESRKQRLGPCPKAVDCHEIVMMRPVGLRVLAQRAHKAAASPLRPCAPLGPDIERRPPLPLNVRQGFR